jgi:tagatose-6-phosphate ketose/aldose isomerase
VNAFETLLSLAAEEKKARGVEYTPREIAQQPVALAKTAELLRHDVTIIRAFMLEAGLAGTRKSVVILTGAGTSEYVGNSIVYALRRGLQREVISIPTTHLVTHMPSILAPDQSYALISFARSGNSPESLAAFDLARQLAPRVKQIAITCSRDGALAKAARADRYTLYIALPEETNDRSLAATSSFSAMALAGTGLALLGKPHDLVPLAAVLGGAAERVIKVYGDALAEFAALPFARACYLGSNTLLGTMQECQMKMMEMTDGRVACRFDSFLGLRHGPQVFVKPDCAVVAALSTDLFVRQYEMDVLRELKARKLGCGTLIICDRATDEIRSLCTTVVELFPRGKPAEDEFRVMTDVVVGQMLALFKSLNLGLKPDSPSPDGTINRVVQGVTIYRR